MKKILIALAPLLCLALILSGCGQKAVPPAEPTPGAATPSPAPSATETPAASPSSPASAGLSNPIVPAENAAAFRELGLAFDAPAGASDIKYSIIGGKVAQIVFTLKGQQYTYRAANTDDDISGVSDPFDETSDISVDGDDWFAIIRVQTRTGGGALAAWQYLPTMYSLYTEAAVERDEFTSLATNLAHDAFMAASAAPSPEA